MFSFVRVTNSDSGTASTGSIAFLAPFVHTSGQLEAGREGGRNKKGRKGWEATRRLEVKMGGNIFVDSVDCALP